MVKNFYYSTMRRLLRHIEKGLLDREEILSTYNKKPEDVKSEKLF